MPQVQFHNKYKCNDVEISLVDYTILQVRVRMIMMLNYFHRLEYLDYEVVVNQDLIECLIDDFHWYRRCGVLIIFVQVCNLLEELLLPRLFLRVVPILERPFGGKRKKKIS